MLCLVFTTKFRPLSFVISEGVWSCVNLHCKRPPPPLHERVFQTKIQV